MEPRTRPLDGAPVACRADDPVEHGDKQAAPEILALAGSGNTRASWVAAPDPGLSTRIHLHAHAVHENLDAIHPGRFDHEAPLAPNSVCLVASASARSGNNDDGLQRSFLALSLDGNCPRSIRQQQQRPPTQLPRPEPGWQLPVRPQGARATPGHLHHHPQGGVQRPVHPDRPRAPATRRARTPRPPRLKRRHHRQLRGRRVRPRHHGDQERQRWLSSPG